MSTSNDFIEYIGEQLSLIEGITIRKMFGEYGIHMRGKFIAGVCNNQLFIKPTAAGREYLGEVTETPPYEGYSGKLYFLIDRLEDKSFLKGLFEKTYEELPQPKPKKPKKPKT